MVLFHSGFGLGGLLEQVLMAFFGVAVISGVYGLIVQHFVPRLMQHAVPDETFIEQIPFLSRCNLILCDQAVAKQCGKLDIPGDPLKETVTGLVDHAAKLGREDRDKWQLGFDSFDKFHPARIGKRKIENDGVGLERTSARKPLLESLRLAADLEIVFGIDQGHQSMPNDGVIIDHKDACRSDAGTRHRRRVNLVNHLPTGTI